MRAGRALPVSEEEAMHVTEACFAAQESLRSGERVTLPRAGAAYSRKEES